MVRPTELNYVTCEYGRKGNWAAGYHTGIDYRASESDGIYATKGGRVVFAGTGGNYGNAYGLYVVIQSFYQGKRRQHLYAHLSRRTVRAGQRVTAGDLVGFGGDTGNAFGPHLHYEERVSPFNYWSHYPPILPPWQPKSKLFLSKILRKIGVRR